MQNDSGLVEVGLGIGEKLDRIAAALERLVELHTEATLYHGEGVREFRVAQRSSHRG